MIIRGGRNAAPALVSLLVLAGCASAQEPGEATEAPATTSPAAASTPDTTSTDTSGTDTSGTDTSGTAAATPDVRTIEITVSGNEVTPPPAQVDLPVGETLRVVVTSDRNSEVHAHGFEVDAPAPAGEPTAIELVGTEPGVYEVELHDPDLLLLQVAVR